MTKLYHSPQYLPSFQTKLLDFLRFGLSCFVFFLSQWPVVLRGHWWICGTRGCGPELLICTCSRSPASQQLSLWLHRWHQERYKTTLCWFSWDCQRQFVKLSPHFHHYYCIICAVLLQWYHRYCIVLLLHHAIIIIVLSGIIWYTFNIIPGGLFSLCSISENLSYIFTLLWGLFLQMSRPVGLEVTLDDIVGFLLSFPIVCLSAFKSFTSPLCAVIFI